MAEAKPAAKAKPNMLVVHTQAFAEAHRKAVAENSRVEILKGRVMVGRMNQGIRGKGKGKGW